MRRFEEQYRINEGDDVLNRENAIHQDVDLRLDAVEQLGQAFAEGNRADIEAILKSLEATFSGLAAEMRGLLDQTAGGLSADIVVETATRYFMTDARRAAILSDLRGGVDGSADTLAKLLGKIAEAASGRVAKAGDIMAGILTLAFANPYCVLKNTDGGVNNNADWRILHFGPDGRLYFQNTDKNGAGVNAFSFGRGGDLNASGMGDVKGYVDRGIRSDFFQGLSRIAQLTAKKNISVETGRRYYTGNGGVVNLSAADIGALVYLEADITQVNVPLAANYADGDYFTVYCRGTVTFNATPGDPYTFGFASHNAGSFVMRPGDRCKIIMGADAWDVVGYTTRHDKALMADRALAFSGAEKKQILANAGLAVPQFQERLEYVSPTMLKVRPFKGTKFFIDGIYYDIPPDGVPLTNATTAAGGVYSAYMYWNGSALVAIASTSVPQVDPTYGHETASQNPAAVLVGTFAMDGSNQFRDSPDVRWVNSHHNKRPRRLRGAAISASTSSTAQVELSTAARVNFLSRAGDAVLAAAFGNGGTNASQAGYAMYSAISLDGADNSPSGLASNAAYGNGSLPSGDAWEPSEGLHYLTVKGSVPSGQSGTFNGAISGLVWM